MKRKLKLDVCVCYKYFFALFFKLQCKKIKAIYSLLQAKKLSSSIFNRFIKVLFLFYKLIYSRQLAAIF